MNLLPRSRLATVGTVLLLVASVSHGATVSENHPHPTSSSHQPGHKYSHRRSKSVRKARPRGQQAIDDGRARQIQEALVREHYLNGQLSGVWDGQTQEAMRRYQQDQGWQSKTVPDSRALIRLGLGPDHQHLLNPESAMTTGSELPRSPAKTQGAAAEAGASFPASTGTNSAPVTSPSVTTARTPAR